jgi:23S rRNA pseudouridine2605 synthase
VSAEVRLQKILSAAGVASRRTAETLIVQGRVTVNGAAVTELGSRADPGRDDIRVDGRRVKIAARRLYLLLYKPRGYVTTRSDPEGRPTVIDLIKAFREYIYPVGRLDYDSEGLLILTNDGDLAARLTHPRHGVEREYEVRVRGVPDQHALDRLARGVMIEGRRTAPARVKLRTDPKRAAGQAVLSIVIHEGRHRQVRNMCDAIGHPVVRLRRVRIGPIEDPRLKPGEYRELSPTEVERLTKAAHAVVPTAAAGTRPATHRSPALKSRSTRLSSPTLKGRSTHQRFRSKTGPDSRRREPSSPGRPRRG